MTTQIPDQMQAQVLEEYNKPYTYKSLPVPKIASEHDILVKVDAASYCHTDAVMASGQMKPNPRYFPHVGSHEYAGTVVAVADSPSEAAKAFSIGTRVGVPGRGYGICGTCFECKNPDEDYPGFSNKCVNGKSNGLSKDGGFAQYSVVDARQLTALPDSMSSLDAAPLMCAGVTIYKALKRCKPTPGKRVGIVGCGGGLGHLGLQFADAMDLRVTGVDAADGPLKLAKSLNTRATIVDARSSPAEEIVRQIGKEDKIEDSGNMGLDAVIILPESQKSFDYGVKLLRDHGVCKSSRCTAKSSSMPALQSYDSGPMCISI